LNGFKKVLFIKSSILSIRLLFLFSLPSRPFAAGKDGNDFSAQRVVNKSAVLDEESMRICYGADSLSIPISRERT
jgi:hypothetical protein